MKRIIFNNPDGTLTPYAFLCGYVERYGDTYPRATLSKEPNDYHVKGFTHDGKHFWEVFTNARAARRFARRITKP
jgi:hypothetical protein